MAGCWISYAFLSHLPEDNSKLDDHYIGTLDRDDQPLSPSSDRPGEEAIHNKDTVTWLPLPIPWIPASIGGGGNAHRRKSKTPLKKACDEHPDSLRHLEVMTASDYPLFSPHHRITGTENSIQGRSRWQLMETRQSETRD
jgi:hypothetical protein